VGPLSAISDRFWAALFLQLQQKGEKKGNSHMHYIEHVYMICYIIRLKSTIVLSEDN
ncbi:hypothetical protein TorRG33x02_338990, partial [Trema orientale]